MDPVSYRLSHLQSQFRALWSSGTSGRVLVCALALALVSLLAVAPAAMHGPWGRGVSARRRLALGADSIVVALGACAWMIAHARAQELGVVLFSPRKPDAKIAYYSAFAATTFGTHLTVLCVLIAVPVLAVASLRIAQSATSRSVLVATAILCVATACGALALADRYSDAFGYRGCMSPEGYALDFRDYLFETARLLTLCKYAIMGLGLAAIVVCAVIAVRDGRRRDAHSLRDTIRCAMLFALGVGVFVATRATAADVYREIQHRPEPNRCSSEASVAPLGVGSCDELFDVFSAPVLVFRNDGYSIDGVPARSSSEVITTLSNRVQLAKFLNPGRAFPGELLVVAPGRTFVRALLFSRLHELGFNRLQLVTSTEPVRVQTATIRTVELVPTCCGNELRLDPDAAPFSADTTYDDLVRAARAAKRTQGILRIAPM